MADYQAKPYSDVSSAAAYDGGRFAAGRPSW